MHTDSNHQIRSPSLLYTIHSGALRLARADDAAVTRADTPPDDVTRADTPPDGDTHEFGADGIAPPDVPPDVGEGLVVAATAHV